MIKTILGTFINLVAAFLVHLHFVVVVVIGPTPGPVHCSDGMFLIWDSSSSPRGWRVCYTPSSSKGKLTLSVPAYFSTLVYRGGGGSVGPPLKNGLFTAKMRQFLP